MQIFIQIFHKRYLSLESNDTKSDKITLFFFNLRSIPSKTIQATCSYWFYCNNQQRPWLLNLPPLAEIFHNCDDSEGNIKTANLLKRWS